MSQSILYHAFGIKGVTYRSTSFLGNAIIFKAETTNRNADCPGCDSKGCIFKGQKTKHIRMPPIGRKQALLDVIVHRLQCKSCGHMWWPKLPFMKGTERYTRSFAQTVLDLLSFGTIKAVANFLHVSWNLVKNIHKNKLAKLYRKISLSDVRYLGMDEFSIRKKHRYMTIFVDLQNGRILHAVEGTSKLVISPFLKKIKKRAKKLKAVAMDMSVSYTSAVKDILPEIPIVFDRYHIMAMMNQQIDNLRRELQLSLNVDQRKYLKGSRYLLLRNYDGVIGTDRSRLDTLLEANAPLYVMHTMKEQLRLFWDKANLMEATSFLVRWIIDAMESNIDQLWKVACTLGEHIRGVIHYYPHKITNGLLEGMNNKIKTMKRQAYGYRDMGIFHPSVIRSSCNQVRVKGMNQKY